MGIDGCFWPDLLCKLVLKNEKNLNFAPNVNWGLLERLVALKRHYIVCTEIRKKDLQEWFRKKDSIHFTRIQNINLWFEKKAPRCSAHEGSHREFVLSFHQAQPSRHTKATAVMVQGGLAAVPAGSRLWLHPYEHKSCGIMSAST